ncbi:MAG: DUF4129 domain-containing protein [Bacteroidota bacterium]
MTFLFLVLSVLMTKGQEVPAVMLDSTQLEVRGYDSTARDVFMRDKDFFYERQERAPLLSWWERVWRSIQEALFTRTLGNLTFWKVVMWVLVIVALGLILFGILRLKPDWIMGRKSQKLGEVNLQSPEDITQMDFRALLSVCLRDQDYRRATRVLYLEVLKELTEQGHIDWKKYKTNHDYLTELRAKHLYEEFSDLTRQYEWAWYGDVPIDKDGFAHMERLFKSFRSKMRL